jgi:hypothetical protein
MSLYKTTVTNRFNDLSRKDYQKRAVADGSSTEEPLTYHEGELLVTLDQLSQETKLVLTLLWNAPVEILHTIEKDFSCPGIFLKKVALFCGIPVTRAERIARNLRKLLKRGEPMKSVYQELIDAAKTAPGYVEPRPGDSKESIITNLLTKIGDVAEDVWKGLSAPAIVWYNAAAEVFNANAKVQNPDEMKPIPEIPGYQAPVVVAPPTAEKPAKVKKEKVAKAPKEPKAPKPPKVAKVKAPPAEGEDDTPDRPKESRPGVTLVIREMLVVNPNVSVADVAAELKNQGFQTEHQSGIVTERHIIRSAVRLAMKNGLWNGIAVVEDERKPRAPRKVTSNETAPTGTETETATVAETETATVTEPAAPVPAPETQVEQGV